MITLWRRFWEGVAIDKYRERVARASEWYDRELDRIEKLPEPKQSEERERVDRWFGGVLEKEPVRDDA